MIFPKPVLYSGTEPLKQDPRYPAAANNPPESKSFSIGWHSLRSARRLAPVRPLALSLYRGSLSAPHWRGSLKTARIQNVRERRRVSMNDIDVLRARSFHYFQQFIKIRVVRIRNQLFRPAPCSRIVQRRPSGYIRQPDVFPARFQHIAVRRNYYQRLPSRSLCIIRFPAVEAITSRSILRNEFG